MSKLSFLNLMRPILLSILVYAAASTSCFSDVLTYHNDAQRTALNPNEINLTTANVNPATFGLIRNFSVDGQVYAQPLYVSSVAILAGTVFKGRHNLVIVCTEQSTVYAFDADSGALWWKTSMLGTNEVSGFVLDCGDIAPNLGVTATPVIDRSQGPFGRIFVLALSQSSDRTTFYERVHALDLSTGRDVLTPVTVQATCPGTGADSNGQGQVVWKPLQQPSGGNPSYGERGRAALLLSGGNIYTAWGSYCDHTPYSGWILSYSETALQQTGVFNSNPNGVPISSDTYQSGDGMWGAGCPLAASTAGDILAETGNGPFDTNMVNGFPQTSDYGDSLIKLKQSNGSITLTDYFTPYNQAVLDANNLDFGSGGLMVLPPMTDSKGVVRNLVVSGDKNATLYISDITNLGKFNTKTQDNSNTYQSVPGALQQAYFCCPAYFNGSIYFGPVAGPLRQFVFNQAVLDTVPNSMSTQSFAYNGSSLSISSNGIYNGIVWAYENDPGTSGNSAVLHAYDATNLANQLYASNGSTNAARDSFGAPIKFATATIGNGKVFAGTANSVGEFGLLQTNAISSNVATPAVAGVSALTASAPQSAINQLVDVQQGPIKYDKKSNRYTQDLIIHNKSGQLLPTPISIVLDNLSYSAALDNATGATSNTNPTGSSYINIPVDVPPGQGTDWAGHQAKLTLVFIDNLQLPITYTPRVVVGPQPR